MKRNTLRWFGHLERMEKVEIIGRVYESEIEKSDVVGRPPVRWINRVEEYVREREIEAECEC